MVDITTPESQIERLRQDFCRAFIERKKRILDRVQTELLARATADGGHVTCHRGCAACCTAYIEANIQECEAICYFLRSRPDLERRFLERHEQWRARMRAYGGIFARCEEIAHADPRGDLSPADREALVAALKQYQQLGIPCSFLEGGACSIYEVRPYVCCNHLVTTPAEWCKAESWGSSGSARQPKIYMTDVSEIYDLSFYVHDLARPVIGFLPSTVYRILTSGIQYVSLAIGACESGRVRRPREE